MTYFITASLIVGWFVLLVYLFHGILEEKPFAKTALVVFITFSLTLIIEAASELELDKPCAEYETRMMWNVSTKTMMPARVCVERAEWIEE